MTETETQTLLDAARAWRDSLIPKTSTGLAAETRVLIEAITALDPPEPSGQENRILWNERGGSIDEIVIHAALVHIEQMSDRVWWIGIDVDGGGYWAGNFHCDSRGRMSFSEQEMDGFEWDSDDTHEVTS